MSDWRIISGDCRDVMSEMDPDSVEAVVTDPPYGLSFMGKVWDGATPGAFVWTQVFRVLKPGGHLLAFGGTRTFHRLTCAIEDAGFEIRDCLMWLYGTGFPKSLDVSKAIDKAAGAEREVVRPHPAPCANINATAALGGSFQERPMLTAPATPDAHHWSGWGTALKPAWEPIIMARKRLVGTVAQNVLKHGTGALNIDGCRVGTCGGGGNGLGSHIGPLEPGRKHGSDAGGSLGRWPANLVLDEKAAEMLDAQSGESRDGVAVQRNRDGEVHNEVFGAYRKPSAPDAGFGAGGGASRFFYAAKASASERDGAAHPTVKPVALMRWLVRLVTPPGGTVLDPFAGSGTTAIACYHEGVDCVGIELSPEYVAMAEKRIAEATRQGRLELGEE